MILKLGMEVQQEENSLKSQHKIQTPTCSHNQESHKNTKLIAIKSMPTHIDPVLAALISVSPYVPCLVDKKKWQRFTNLYDILVQWPC